MGHPLKFANKPSWKKNLYISSIMILFSSMDCIPDVKCFIKATTDMVFQKHICPTKVEKIYVSTLLNFSNYTK